ncbi:indolepyruvate oxidoreductase subunit beta [Geobacter sp. DSM 9736]|uniref:indolepyruvate oxidoreductase subunit beta n=1 Tax=Geobacter sp. DSM 9736 TaxID=1277350 RepID=UPI000B510B06|nr:indolepyruvate oxidoreductase subunit beta [Geobacter sp. DSM 9736]SNB47259.1 indolepyruvate ferredoxin oxidoreductase beta subunit [Geobacter sp. DSM 9736]
MISQQLIISGVGGQGILFVTRLLAETAISKGLPVMTSETHGMAQRGGIVISHLKVGEFASPLVRPGQADGLLALKPENVMLHRHFLRKEGWIVGNASSVAVVEDEHPIATLDADAMALSRGTPQAVNLMVLGRALAEPGRLFCSVGEVEEMIRVKLVRKPALLEDSLAALRAGIEA